MKKTSFIVFLVLLVVSVVWAGILVLNTSTRFTPRNELVGKNLVDRLTTAEVEEVRIANADNEVVLKRKDGKWVVPSRGDYPIDSEKEVQRLVASILSLQVGLEIPAEPRHYALMKLLSPDEEDLIEKFKAAEIEKGEEDPADPSGLLIQLKGADGKDLAHLILGEDFGGDPSQPRRGIVLRSIAGNTGAWKVLGSVNRQTGELGGTDVRRGPLAESKSWLAYGFIEVEKIKSISLSAPNDSEFKGWTITRDSVDGDFTMDGLTQDEELDSAATGSFKTLFSSLRFEDILDPAEAEQKRDSANARQAVIVTFEGFTYTFDLAPIVTADDEKDEDEDDDGPPPPPSNYLGTVKVEGTFPQTREKVEGETEERAQAEDQAHALRLENLQAKLAREKAYESHTFEFARYTMTSLLKGRDEVVKEKAPPSPEDDETPAGIAPPIGNRPTAVTPPVRVPPVTPPPQE